ncbi:ankyrin repeat domain-containing protein [Marinoscillum pacificum]|uniref:ankyrin repeat domain-containing protein n=1 Tax=Marinoscillum pacificum TaxID=392723 RepID=UPI0021574D95|nr:ankyrin repeat domain-containing protein [Marinoscillum pacificum]
MKTLMIKNVIKGTFFIALLTLLVSCNSQPSSSTTESASNAKAPDIDIHAAVITGNLEAVKQHIEAGSDLNQPDPFGGSSPLITAALFGNEEIVKTLLDAGVKVNFTNKEGSTALHTAAFFCETEIVKLLLENGADKSIKNTYGSTALMSVEGSFEDVKGIYIMMEKQLSPMGFSLDLQKIESTRPEVAKILKS